jgi:hypothetical protein
MKTTRIAALAITSALLAAPAADAKLPTFTAFEDPSGDADNGQGLGQSIPAGFDLTAGYITYANKELGFTVEHADMPSVGSAPEAFRFLWHFNVGDHEYRFTVKSVDIGKPDVIAQSGTERVGQIDTSGHFRLEECVIEATPAIQLAQCQPLAYFEGVFDPANKTFSFKMPLSAIKAKPGTVINPGTGGASGTGCQICWVSHYAERSLTPYTILDAAVMTAPYKIPKK